MRVLSSQCDCVIDWQSGHMKECIKCCKSRKVPSWVDGCHTTSHPWIGMMDDGVMWLGVLFPNGRRMSLYGRSGELASLTSKSLYCIALSPMTSPHIPLSHAFALLESCMTANPSNCPTTNHFTMHRPLLCCSLLEPTSKCARRSFTTSVPLGLRAFLKIELSGHP